MAEVTLTLTDDDPVISIVTESGDGKYTVHFTPENYRNHTVSIKVNGHHISDSPTELKVDVKHKGVLPVAPSKSSKEMLLSEPSYSRLSVTSNYLVHTTSTFSADNVYLLGQIATSLTSENKSYSKPHAFKSAASFNKPKYHIW